MEELNGKQNERIAKLEVKVDNLKEIFNKFIANDFKHLEEKVKKLDDRVWWILGTIIVGFVISITLNLLV